MTSIQSCIWTHEDRIDWIELNETGKLLLFRDRSLKLHLLDVMTQEYQVLLTLVGFVQWVPNSDVIVAQSRDILYVWYDHSKPVIYEIESGRIEATGIERENGITKVTFSGSAKSHEIILDEAFLEFDTALHDGDLERATSFLESCGFSSESDNMWRTLGKVALKEYNLSVAERAFAAVGDVAKVSFIREAKDDHSKLALLDNDWDTFEANEDFDDAVEFYIKINKWNKAIDLASKNGRSDIKDDLESRYYDYLIQSGQESEAASLKEKSGDLEEAIRLYIQSGRVVQAARVILDRKRHDFSRSQIETVVQELKKAGFYDEAGELYESSSVNDYESALDCYRLGHNYPKAIELARKEFPEEVVKLEEDYGNYLLAEGHDPSAAVSHLIEAGKTEKAMEAAIRASQFERAAEISFILNDISPDYGRQIGHYYVTVKNDLDAAVDIYLKSGLMKEAIDILNTRGQYSKGYKLAKKMVPEDDVREMYQSMAIKMVEESKYKDAEKIYLMMDDSDAAISMYKNHKMYDQMIRLVKSHHPDLLEDTHIHLAKDLEKSSNYSEAEQHYLAIGDWKQCIQMYKSHDLWEDAYRIARQHGPNSNIPTQVAFMWAQTMSSSEEAVRLLIKYGILHQVVDYSIESKNFEFAKQLVSTSPDIKHRLSEIHSKHGMALEEESRFDEAEGEYIKAKKPKEAIMMYVHKSNFNDAIRVAEEQLPNDQNTLSDILVAQAKYLLSKGGRSSDNMSRIEQILLRANRIELVVKMYKENEMFDEAIRICESYAPHLLESVKRDIMRSTSAGTSRGQSRVPSRGMRTSETRGYSAREQDYDDLMDDGNDLKKSLLMAEKSGDREKSIKFSLLLSTQLIKEKDPFEALKVMTSHPGVFVVPESKKIMLKIANDLFSFEYEPRDSQTDTMTWRSLRDSLNQLIPYASVDSEMQQIEKYLLISHYLILKTSLHKLVLKNQNGASDLFIKLSVSLLRYTDVLRTEKFFFEAGNACKDHNRIDMAFVFLNHFLDLSEAIDDHDPNVDHTDFESTDIPSEVPLSSSNYYPDPSIIEGVKGWILQTSMENNSSQSLPSCPFREGDVYEASLRNTDGSKSYPCLVTGYPVIKHKMMELKNGKYAANKDDWNKLLMVTKVFECIKSIECSCLFQQVSQSEDLKEILLFIGKLCGNASVARFSFQ